MGWLGRFLPPLAVMGLIFFLSAQPDLKTDFGTIDLILRKAAHMAVFGALWLAWCRALGWRAPAPAAAAAIALAYAISDEWHQTFVDGRSGHPRDVAFDAAGIAIAWALWARLRPAPRSSRVRSP